MIISVSELNEQAKTLLELNLSNLNVKGEISRLTKHSSGHWYFTLKTKMHLCLAQCLDLITSL